MPQMGEQFTNISDNFWPNVNCHTTFWFPLQSSISPDSKSSILSKKERKKTKKGLLIKNSNCLSSLNQFPFISREIIKHRKTDTLTWQTQIRNPIMCYRLDETHFIIVLVFFILSKQTKYLTNCVYMRCMVYASPHTSKHRHSMPLVQSLSNKLIISEAI